MIELLQRSPWTVTAAFALAAVLGGIAVHRGVRALLKRLVQHTLLRKSTLEATERAGSAVLPLLALQAVWQVAPDPLDYIGVVRHVNGLLLIGALTWWITSFINGFAAGVMARHPAAIDDNLQARRIHTQARVLSQTAIVVVMIAGIAVALMTFPGARQIGASLLASAGVLGIVGGLAARPVFSNMIAGLQIALAQPIRLDDVLIVQGEWGRVEEITGTYVVLKIWDERRLIIPLQWFIENPFENWTRTGSQLLGSVLLHLDWSAPMDVIRAEARKIAEAAPEWDRRVFGVQVTDATERAMQVRILVSSHNASAAFDLRCKIREGVLGLLAREHPHSLPKVRMADAAG